MEKRILSLARQHDRVQSLMPNVNEETLRQAYWSQPDTAIKVLYGENLEENLQKLLHRMKAFSYFPRTESGQNNRKDLKQEFRFFEDKIVESVFTKILKLIYDVKNPVVFLPKDGSFHNVGERPVLYPYIWRVEFRVLSGAVDQKKMIEYLGQYTADKNFIKYLRRFLESGIMERQVQSDDELSSGKALSSIFMNIYCYHILKDWLYSKSSNFKGKVYLCFNKECLCFKAYKITDLYRICNGLVDDQRKAGLQMVNNTYIESVLILNSRKYYYHTAKCKKQD